MTEVACILFEICVGLPVDCRAWSQVVESTDEVVRAAIGELIAAGVAYGLTANTLPPRGHELAAELRRVPLAAGSEEPETHDVAS